ASRRELPHPVLPGSGVAANRSFAVHYDEGAAVGYKWYQQRGLKPQFAFGYGLSYSRFGYSGLTTGAAPDGRLRVSFTVSNLGRRGGAAVAQVYAGSESGGWEAPRRLAGWW